VAEAFVELLELLAGRAPRSELLDWLARPVVRARLGLEEESVERIAEWAVRAGYRFGIDGPHRAALGLGRDGAHTLRDAVERLALAHALGATDEVFAGRAPIPLDAFAEPEILGALGDLEALLARARHEIAVPRTVAGWGEWLGGLLERAIDARDANADGHTAIRRVLQQLVEAAREVGFEGRIPFEAMSERVRQTLSASPAPQAFLSGGVTFCELVPLRAIPFRVVVIVGLGDETFPRAGASPGFDLTTRWPRVGDRSPRDDDRYLFLEALLSARDRVILTVPARDLRDGSDRPPSIVLAELLDALDARFTPDASPGPDGSARLRDRIVVAHPLVAHSPRYFRPDRIAGLVPRDAEAFRGAAALEAARSEGGGRLRRFLSDDGLPAAARNDGATEACPILELEVLISRIVAATRTFARERLGLSLPRLEEARPDLDPVRLDPLERFGLGEALLAERLERATPEDAAARLEARPTLPSGLPGRLAARSVEQEVEAIVAAARALGQGRERTDAAVDLRLTLDSGDAVRLVGRLDGLRQEGRIEVGFQRLGGSAELSVWIRHLVLCACVEAGLPVTPESVLVGRPPKPGVHDRAVGFEAVAEPLTRLAELAGWALEGDRRPLPFFPRASREFAEKAAAGKLEQAWRSAHKELLGGEDGGYGTPEFDRALEYPLVWEGSAPLAPAGSGGLQARFDAVAEAFFKPLLEARRVLRE
jgi:exodeoxyribonuclease V gamma subunit